VTVAPILGGAPLPGPDASRDLPVPDVVVAIGAHPDDIEFHCGATLAGWAAKGATVHVVICTDGSKGTWDPDADTTRLATIRADEASKAARILGATGEVVLMGVVDGDLRTLAPGSDLHDELVAVLRRLRPDVVLGHDPWRRYRLHPDHRHAGWLTVDACVASRDPHFLADAGPAHRPTTLLLFEADEPDHVETASEVGLATKVAALLAHRSQWRSTMDILTDDEVGASDGAATDARADQQIAAFTERVITAARLVGEATGGAPGESFRRLAL
jgi:LmbE family N-acetylglucosaminyl deacetylase